MLRAGGGRHGDVFPGKSFWSLALHGAVTDHGHGKAMEESVMSLSAWEQQALDSIRNEFTGSDPGLVALLASFTELAAGEEMPALEKIRTGSRRPVGRPRRGRHSRRGLGGRYVRAVWQRLGFRWTALLLWVTISAGLIATELALSGGSGQASTCTTAWPTVCASPAPATGSHPAAHDPSGGQRPVLVPSG
jgi:hypothetical protein